MEGNNRAAFEPGGLISDRVLHEQPDIEARNAHGVYSNTKIELSIGYFDETSSVIPGIDVLYEGLHTILPGIKERSTEKDDAASDSGESSTYSSDVPLLEPSKDSDQPFDEKYNSANDFDIDHAHHKIYENKQLETVNADFEDAYTNRSSDTGTLVFAHSSPSVENVHTFEISTETSRPRTLKKMELVAALEMKDSMDNQPVNLDYIDYVEVREVSVTPLHVIGACWEFGSMSSVNVPHKESSGFRSRTNTIDQQSYAGSHRDVYGGSNKLLTRVFSNTIGSMEFGKKESKEMSLTFLPSSESQTDNEHEYPKRLICNQNSKNLLVLSTGVTLMFIAMLGLTNLQSSMNSEGGLGVYSLAMGFGAFMVGSLFSPIIVKRFRPKACLIMGCLSPLFYVLVNFHPTFAFFLPASFILGLSKVILWNAVSTYITEIGINESTRKGKPADNVISRYFGIFFLTLQLAFVFGNLLSSLILVPSSINDFDTFVTVNTSNATYSSEMDAIYTATLNETQSEYIPAYVNSTSVCGSGYCNSDDKNGSQTVVDDLRKTILLGIYSCCIILSTIVLVLFLDHLPNYEASYANFRDVAYQAKSVFMMLFDGQFLLILVLCMYTIISNGFIIADILKAYVTCPLGIHMVGYTMIYFGLTGALSSYVSGKLVKHTGRVAIYITAAAINVGSLIWMITWQPTADDTNQIFVLLGLWGLAEGIWQSQINSLISSVFADRYEEAFGCCRLAQGFAGIFVFTVSENFCMMTKISITMTTCILGVVLYIVMELIRKVCPRKQVTQEVEININ